VQFSSVLLVQAIFRSGHRYAARMVEHCRFVKLLPDGRLHWQLAATG